MKYLEKYFCSAIGLVEMKISAENSSLQMFTSGLRQMFGLNRTQAPDSSVKETSGRNNAFSAWGQEVDPLSQKNTGEWLEIDVVALEKMVKKISVDKGSLKGFLFSQLQSEAGDDRSTDAMKRTFAAQKMLSLVMSTVKEMRAIEIKYLSNTKG